MGVIVPSLTALKTLPAACEASVTSCIRGRGKRTGLSFIGGAMRSIQSRKAMLSPSNAFDIAVWVKASAWPSSRLSIAMVALLREPLGRPAFPSENLPSVFRPFCMVLRYHKLDHFAIFQSLGIPFFRSHAQHQKILSKICYTVLEQTLFNSLKNDFVFSKSRLCSK